MDEIVQRPSLPCQSAYSWGTIGTIASWSCTEVESSNSMSHRTIEFGADEREQMSRETILFFLLPVTNIDYFVRTILQYVKNALPCSVLLSAGIFIGWAHYMSLVFLSCPCEYFLAVDSNHTNNDTLLMTIHGIDMHSLFKRRCVRWAKCKHDTCLYVNAFAGHVKWLVQDIYNA